MLNLRDLSFRYKIPLRSTVLVLVTAVPLTIAGMLHEYGDLKRTLIVEKMELSRVLAQNLAAPMLQDDLWHSYKTLQSLTPGRPWNAGATPGAIDDTTVMVLDPAHRVYVSSDPSRYPLQGDPLQNDTELRQLQAEIAGPGELSTRVVEPPGSSRIYILQPVASDGIALGTLVLGFSESAFLPDFYRLTYMSIFITLIVLAVLLPMSWYWAHRMAIPLVQLAKCMSRIGTHIPEDLQCVLYESKDEIGQVGAAFREMFGELRKKEYLEKQMATSERLAAVGRLSAGIAHEINNPLGGMLNAVNTLKHHGNMDPLTTKTISLLERGLLQIKDTVAALLVEARVESNKPLSRQDIEDTRTLVLGKAKRKSAELEWHNELPETVPLPSTLVRQVLINLLLNAIQAADDHGYIHCRVYLDDNHLLMVVENNGEHIPPERMEHLFEPFATHGDSGHGLGLWVTYQAVRQMGGGITVESEPGHTGFTIALPLDKRS